MADLITHIVVFLDFANLRIPTHENINFGKVNRIKLKLALANHDLKNLKLAQ